MAETTDTKPSRGDVTKRLSVLTERYISPKNDPRIYWAKEVTFDYSSLSPIRVDYMEFRPVNNTISGIEHGDVYVYEIKSSVEDFHSKNGHNMIGDYNYYVMPEEVFEKVKTEIPYAVGVLSPEIFMGTFDSTELKSVKRAKRTDRRYPLTEVLLMMFRSYKRDVEKKERKKGQDLHAESMRL